MTFYKTKKFWIIAAVILLVVWIGYGRYQKANQPPAYETVPVMRGNLAQTVEATGKLQSANDLMLRFETAGTLETIKVKEGDQVKAGQLLASLRLSELNAAVAQAAANLNLKLAGGNEYEVKSLQAAVDAAKADWDKTKADTANSVAAYEAAAATAKNNLKLAEGGENSEIVNQAYEDAVAALQTAASKLDDGLTQADNILGVDNTAGNDSFDDYLSLKDLSKLAVANSQYLTTKLARDSARTAIAPLTSQSAHTAIDAALALTETALTKMNQLLFNVSDVLIYTPIVGDLTQASLDAKKTTIETTRATIATQYTSVIAQKQALSDAKNSYGSYLVAYNKAVSDLDNARITAASAVIIKEAAYNQAVANWENKTKPPREVDVAPYRAALAQAVANRDKAVIRAPIDGVISKINKKKGELVAMTDTPVEMVSPHFEVEVDIPETDVAKLKVGDTVTTTLDAFGDDIKFGGTVLSIDPASTEIQDVVYYKVKMAINDTAEPIKPGMTANVTVATDSRENVLYIPSRAVRTNGEKYVKVLTGKEVKDVPIKIDLKADDAKVEVIEGLNEGDLVVVGTK